MRLDRNDNGGRGKYALILLRKLESFETTGTFGPAYTPEVQAALDTLDKAGALDWGMAETDAEFFLIRLKDRSAAPALHAYAVDACEYDQEWAREVFALADAARAHPNKKTPD